MAVFRRFRSRGESAGRGLVFLYLHIRRFGEAWDARGVPDAQPDTEMQAHVTKTKTECTCFQWYRSQPLLPRSFLTRSGQVDNRCWDLGHLVIWSSLPSGDLTLKHSKRLRPAMKAGKILNGYWLLLHQWSINFHWHCISVRDGLHM